MILLSKSFRNRCETISAEKRIELNLCIFDPLPANILVENCKARVCRPDGMEMPQEVKQYFLGNNKWWGFLFPFHPPIIVYNPNQSSARYESTVMHELAHLILKHPPERIYVAPDGTFHREFDDRLEAEAAYLGSCLQIPRRGLLWTIQKGKNNQEIAHHFGASIEMVSWRQNAVNPGNT